MSVAKTLYAWPYIDAINDTIKVCFATTTETPTSSDDLYYLIGKDDGSYSSSYWYANAIIQEDGKSALIQNVKDLSLKDNTKITMSINGKSFGGKRDSTLDIIIEDIPIISVIKDSTGKTVTVNGQPLVKINIPLEYTRVKYIASTGTQHIDTGVIPTSDNIIYEWEGRDDVASGYTSLFASEWSIDGDYSNRVFGGVIHGSKSSRPVYIGKTTGMYIEYNSNDNLFHQWSLVINADHTIYLIKDGTKLTTYNWTGSMNKYNTIALFCNHTTNSFSQNASVAYKWFRIKDNGKIVFWGIPVRRNSDSVLGMYDVISETFFDNDGTGTFVTE